MGNDLKYQQTYKSAVIGGWWRAIGYWKI